jgi:hypothetical protein
MIKMIWLLSTVTATILWLKIRGAPDEPDDDDNENPYL